MKRTNIINIYKKSIRIEPITNVCNKRVNLIPIISRRISMLFVSNFHFAIRKDYCDVLKFANNRYSMKEIYRFK